MKTNTNKKMGDFERIYEEVSKNYENELERIGNQVKKEQGKRTIICIAIILLIICLTRNNFITIMAIIIGVISLKTSKPLKEYQGMFKEKVIKPFIEGNFNNLKYTPKKGMTTEVYRDAEFEGFTIFNSEDYIEGTLSGGLKIEMAEVRSSAKKTPGTLYNGICEKIHLQKSVNFGMKIRARNIKAATILEKYEKINMGLPEFKESFIVHTSDKAKCMKMLTPNVMRLMLEFKNTKNLTAEIVLKDDRLYIRFNTGDLFEPDITRNRLERQTFYRYYDTITSILEFSESITKNIMETEI